jgi:hypothetical protein
LRLESWWLRAKIGATGFELEARASQSDAYNGRLTKRLTKIFDFDINAWRDLPANLKAAIMAIVGPDSLSHR